MEQPHFNPFSLLSQPSDDSSAPLHAFHLLCLRTSIASLRAALATTPLTPLILARILGWIVKPTTLSIDPLLSPSTTWHLLLIHPITPTTTTTTLPPALTPHIRTAFTLTACIPAPLLTSFPARNTALLDPPATANPAPPLTGALRSPSLRLHPDGQHLKMTPALLSWAAGAGAGTRAVSMLNLLALEPGREADYLEYGRRFHAGPGAARGGVAKVVGRVVDDGGGAGVRAGGEEARKRRVWDEVAVAHYPSLAHFADMVAGEDYQAINDGWRVGSLRDTLILCTSEVVLEEGDEEGLA